MRVGTTAGGRTDGSAAGLPVGITLCLLTAGSAIRLPAQTSLHVSLGARYSSTLVHDSIRASLDVRPDIAPALGAALGLALTGPWRLELSTDLSTSPLQLHDADGTTTRMTRLWVLGMAVGLRKQLNPWLHARGSIGGLKYLTTTAIGMFAAGTGGVMPYGSMTFDFAPPPLARHHLAFEAAGDVHRFLTPALRTSGFTEPRFVYRVGLGVRADLRRSR
jgi:hypothetical protein